MVLTGVVRTSDRGRTRRHVLAGAVLGLGGPALAGCGLLDEPAMPAPAATPDPLQPLLDETLALIAAYGRAVAAQPGLTARLAPLADDHRAHAAALADAMGAALPSFAAAASVAGPSAAGPSPAGQPPAGPSVARPAASPAAVLARLRAAEEAGQRNAAAACLRATPARAALVGSIAACRATHAEALR